jgi:hypothetical protein
MPASGASTSPSSMTSSDERNALPDEEKLTAALDWAEEPTFEG